MKGWFGNKVKHSLASKGIKTINKFVNPEKKKEIIDIIYDSKIGDKLSEDTIYQYVQQIHSKETDWEDGDLGDRIEEFKQYRLEKIKLDSLDDEWALDYDVVNNYKQQYLDSGVKFYPPIVVKRYKGGDYSIIDGTYRVEALKNVGNKKWILAWVGYND